MARVLVIQPDEDKPLGRLEAPLRDAGLDLDVRVGDRDPLTLDGHLAVVALSGFADPVDDTEAVRATRAAFATALERSIPALGICLGAQLLAQAGGAAAGRCDSEYGYAPIDLAEPAGRDPLLSSLPRSVEVFHAHDYAVSLPPGAVPLARTANALQGFSLGPSAWGFQFHPEPSVEIVDSWVATHHQVLRSHGADPEQVAQDARRLDRSATEVAQAIAGGFARAVLAAGGR